MLPGTRNADMVATVPLLALGSTSKKAPTTRVSVGTGPRGPGAGAIAMHASTRTRAISLMWVVYLMICGGTARAADPQAATARLQCRVLVYQDGALARRSGWRMDCAEMLRQLADAPANVAIEARAARAAADPHARVAERVEGDRRIYTITVEPDVQTAIAITITADGPMEDPRIVAPSVMMGVLTSISEDRRVWRVQAGSPRVGPGAPVRVEIAATQRLQFTVSIEE